MQKSVRMKGIEPVNLRTLVVALVTAQAAHEAELWPLLVAGRVCAVDVFDRGSVRYWVATETEDGGRESHLSPREKRIAVLAARGFSNGEIGFELQLSDSQVSTIVSCVLRRLGLRLRADLPLCYRARVSSVWRREGQPDVLCAQQDLWGAEACGLTGAERAVAVLAMQGASNAEIAERRGSSERTVANQLRSVFTKLGIQSRFELAGALLDPPGDASLAVHARTQIDATRPGGH